MQKEQTPSLESALLPPVHYTLLDPTTRYVTEIDPCVVNAVFVKLMELEDEQEETNHMNEIEQDELDEDMTAEL